MSKKINCVMLVDDNADDNFFHERVIKKSGMVNSVIVKQTGRDALQYLISKSSHEASHPDLIFLDINMPGMNGWEFLIEYNKLDKIHQCHAIVVMLTTSDDPVDEYSTKKKNIASDFKTKPLTTEMLMEVIEKYF